MIELYTAFSRDQPQKIYVQTRLREQGQRVWNALQNGVLYISGSAKQMPKDVFETLVQIVLSFGKSDETSRTGRNFTDAEARQYLKKMKAEKRYVVEAWS